ncbi:De-etiolated protein 1 Det1 [Musa troglodytarum]|uniref:De-etiolated protein 1 Det1 n=1 Tax=Musa troglodytarum TaxID=320322 RepID=A0A9E7GQ00_9LILI|nr:De-etiolated protein 1 Det1 [Musa troglodytarum]URE15999.1 De-etiolated protein 1 Det1 [Musa troglodytarum]
MFRGINVAARVFERQILTPRPGASINLVRHFYENLVPSYTICDIDCPDHSLRKITDDGRYLVSFSRNLQDIIVYRPTWLSFSFKGENCDYQSLTQKAKKFDSFFTQLYSVSLGSSSEFICKDFFLYLEDHQFGLFATSTAQSHEVPAIEGAIHGVPSIEKITFHLVRLKDGVVMDEKSFCNDFVNLAHSMGVFLYEDLLCIMSLRYQTIHILQVRDSGNLVDVRNIGSFCLEDDELFLNSHAQCMIVPNKGKLVGSVHESANGIHHEPVAQASSFLTGIKQRLLSFIFHKAWSEEADPILRVQHLKKKFYFHFQDYVDLIMWKAQFLDRHHLLIKFGSVDGGVSRSTDQHPAFFAVYNMETTEIIAFYQNSSEELYSLFEQFYDHFHANSRESVHANFISSHSNNIHALEQLWSMKNKQNSFSQFVKKMMTSIPYTCQSQSPSPYFDVSLFRYDEKLISSTDRHRHSTDHPIKFISRRQPNALKFKIKPGLETSGAEARTKKICSFLFHPYLPMALSIQQTYMQPTVVNLHLRM